MIMGSANITAMRRISQIDMPMMVGVLRFFFSTGVGRGV